MTPQLCSIRPLSSWLRTSDEVLGLPSTSRPGSTAAAPGDQRPARGRTRTGSVQNTQFIARSPLRWLIGRTGAGGLAPVIADPANGIVDMHPYTFNAIDITDVAAGYR